MTALLLALVVCTWNGNWFPSGRAEHRASESVEAARIGAAGRMLRSGLDQADPAGTNGVILILNEMRNREVVERLVKAIGRADLKLASISAYRRRDRFDQQQDAIVTSLPVANAHWARWAYDAKANPPRGFAYAALVVEPAVTACVYAVHLKSNYGATTAAARDENRAKRTAAIAQFLRRAKDEKNVVLGGDFNADRWQASFAAETIFASLESAGFLNLLAALPPSERVTHPSVRYGGSALDYLMVRGFDSAGNTFVLPRCEVSDHVALVSVIRSPGAVLR